MHLSLSVEKLGCRSPMFDETVDGEAEEDEVEYLQHQDNAVLVDELRGLEEVRPGSLADHPLGVPCVAQVAVSGAHVGEDPVTGPVLVHQVHADHHQQGGALLSDPLHHGTEEQLTVLT